MYTKTCQCGVEFQTNNYRQTKHNKNCGKKQASPNKARHKKLFEDLEFVGVDGEGANRPDGQHDYIMLSVGDSTLTNPDGSQLSYDQIFTFLYSEYEKRPHAAFVGFFLKYDFIQWTRSLPEDRAFQLWDSKAQARRKPKSRKNPDPFPVYHEGWEFDILAGRRFRLRRHVCKKKQHKDECAGCNRVFTAEDAVPSYTATPDSVDTTADTEEITDWKAFWGQLVEPRKGNSWMYICDTGGFWQQSFLAAINPKKWPTPVCTPEEYATIKEGKGKRDVTIPYGDTSFYSDMARYNTLENIILARITSIINEGFIGNGLKLAGREWYGPGRAAQLWLTSISKALGDGEGFTRSEIANEVPFYALDAGRKSYYGGWFEQFAHGHIPGTVHEYDINSAYPYIIANLPCLLHGTWDHGEGNPVSGLRTGRNGRIRMLHATVQGRDPYIGAMPYRSKQGRILRPRHVTGWYWEHELEAAQSAGLADTIEIHEWVSYDQCDCPPPLAPIADLYLTRLVVGKESPQGRGLKLVYNSAYGKMAQSIGEPKFANPIYASLITAGCRTMILDAIGSHPQGTSAVVMVATDGVYFTSPHDSLEMHDEKLGAWGYKAKENMTQFMPGVYWDDKSREKIAKNELPELKSRGINARDLAKAISHLDDDFRRFADSYSNGSSDSLDWPKMDLTTSFEIVSCNQALQRRRWDLAGHVSQGKIRQIDSNPFRKRATDTLYEDGGLIRTRPYDSDAPVQSVDYDKHFGMELAEKLIDGESVTPDGDNGDLLAWMLNAEG